MLSLSCIQYRHSQECPLAVGTPVLPPPKGRAATRAHAKRQYGRWRQIVETINGHLTCSFGLHFPGARTPHGLLAAGNLGLWLNHRFGRPALALTTLFPGL